MVNKRGSEEVIKEILEIGNRLKVKEVLEIAEYVDEVGGTLVSVDGDGADDDWCGNGYLRLKWPPKDPNSIVRVVDKLVECRVNFEVLVNGIPAPREILMRVFREKRFVR